MKTTDLVMIIFTYIIISFLTLIPKDTNILNIEIWDVGQGDSIYISTPNGKKILIDGGDNYEADFKLSNKIPYYFCKIDLLVLTHPHYDHINGLNRILRRCKVGTIMFNDVVFTSRDFSIFKSITTNLNILNVYVGDEFEIDNVKFKILWPSKDFLQNKITDINDSSIVLFLDYGDFEALLTGDATLNVLEKLDLNDIKNDTDGDFDLLKVPHHGSKYSLAKWFYTDLKPKICAISVGKGNKFGHPSIEVENLLKDLKCSVIRTDIEGDIKIRVKAPLF